MHWLFVSYTHIFNIPIFHKLMWLKRKCPFIEVIYIIGVYTHIYIFVEEYMYIFLRWRRLSSSRTMKTFRKRCGNGRGKQLWQKDTRDVNEDKIKEEASCFPLWARSVHGVRGSWLWQPPTCPSPVVAWHGQVQTWGGSTSGWGAGFFQQAWLEWHR